MWTLFYADYKERSYIAIKGSHPLPQIFEVFDVSKVINSFRPYMCVFGLGYRIQVF